MTGFLVIDKPSGLSSHDVCRLVRRKLGIRKVGHIGTLDPLATGVLPLCIGGATRLARFFENGEKEYTAIIRLGEETDTYDSKGEIISKGEVSSTNEDILSAVAGFKGRIRQIPPMYSAVKKGGMSLYKLARRGIEIEREPREIEIHDIEVKDIASPLITIRVLCSKGTYIRSLAFDIGRKLGCGAHLAGLRRVKSGIFSIEGSISGDALHHLQDNELKDSIIPVERLFPDVPSIEVDGEAALRIMNGVPPAFHGNIAGDFFPSIGSGKLVRFTTGGKLLAIASYSGEGSFKLERVFKNYS